MDLSGQECPWCGNKNIQVHTSYATQNHGTRKIHHCRECDSYVSDTFFTPMAGLKTPLSRIITILKARTEGLFSTLVPGHLMFQRKASSIGSID